MHGTRLTAFAAACALAVSFAAPASAADDDGGWAKLYFKVPLSSSDTRESDAPRLGFAFGVGPTERTFGAGSSPMSLAYRDDSGRMRWGGARFDVTFTPERFEGLMLNGVEVVDHSGRLFANLPPTREGQKRKKRDGGPAIYVGFSLVALATGFAIYNAVESDGDDD